MEGDKKPLSRRELRDLNPYMDIFEERELLEISEQVGTHHHPHANRAPLKWRKCLHRSQRIAESAEMLRSNLTRLIQLTFLGKRPSRCADIRKKMRTACGMNFASKPITGALRGGLNHDGPLIPVWDETDISAIDRMLELGERWDDDDPAKDLRTKVA